MTWALATCLETNNCAGQHPELVKQMDGKLLAWRKTIHVKYTSPEESQKFQNPKLDSE
jgi:hypothetical protein